MAEYGPNSGKVAFTGFTAVLADGTSLNPAVSGAVKFNGVTQNDGHLSRLLRSRGNRAVRAIMRQLLNGAVGGTATETHKRIKSITGIDRTNTQQGGGLVTLETATDISRVTTSTDVTNMVAAISRVTKPSSYASDLSGNGAGKIAGW